MATPKKKKRRTKAGLPPGSVVFLGNQKVEKVFVHHLQYDNEQLNENTLDNHKDITFQATDNEQIDWYDVRGLHDTALIESIGKTFHIHPLVLEDVVNTQQRPKFEEYENGIFIIFKSLFFDKTKFEITTEQVALFLTNGLILSFQEAETDLFAAVRQRVHSGRGRIRLRGIDYLAYALLDNVVDNYYVIFDEIEEVIEALEDQLMASPDNSIKGQIHHLKKELLTIRKSIAPLREAVSQFAKSDNELIEDRTVVYIRDLYDHTVQIMDRVETYRDMLNGLQDLYLSEISYKMNQVMQLLAVVTTVFVPLSFLAGLYGMNFENIPELKYANGYFVLLGVMVLIVVGLLFFFRKKKWF
ncbi:MAG: magnesium/cobalt transporter CorA [Saprospiraceae bacterium]